MHVLRDWVLFCLSLSGWYFFGYHLFDMILYFKEMSVACFHCCMVVFVIC